MCVAILSKPGASVPNDMLWKGWTVNKDGAGFAYVHDGKVIIKKGFMSYNDFQTAYRAAVEQFGEDSPMLVHMRIKTVGSVTAKNCHPFKIKNGAMIHNGTLFYPTGEAGKVDKSDSRLFAEKMYNILQLEDVVRTEKEFLYAFGRTNKMAFLYDNKDYAILNEESGMWIDDVWYSNGSCKIFTPQTR